MEEVSGWFHTYHLIAVKPNLDGTTRVIYLSPGSSEVLSLIEITSSFAYNEMEKGHDIHFSVLAELVINFTLLLTRGETTDIIPANNSHWIDGCFNEFIVIMDFAKILGVL